MYWHQGREKAGERYTLRAVDEDRDGEKVVTDRTLAVVEDRSGRDAELVFAGGALPQRARLEGADLKTAATRAVGLAAVVGPADALEVARASSSDMRATDASESVLAAAERIRQRWKR